MQHNPVDGDLQNILQRIDRHVDRLEMRADGVSSRREASRAASSRGAPARRPSQTSASGRRPHSSPDASSDPRRRARAVASPPDAKPSHTARRGSDRQAARASAADDGGSDAGAGGGSPPLRAARGGSMMERRLVRELQESKKQLMELAEHLRGKRQLEQKTKFQRDREGKDRQILTLQRQLHQMDRERLELQTRVNSLEAAEGGLKQENAALRRAQTDAKNAKEEVKVQGTVLQKLREKLRKYADELVASDSDRKALHGRLVAAANDIRQLRQRCLALDEARKALASDAKRKTELEQTALFKEREALLDYAEEAKGRISDLERARDRLAGSVVALEEELKQSHQHDTAAREQVQALQAKCEDLRRQAEKNGAEEVRQRALEADEMEAVQGELLDTVARQNRQIEALQRELASATGGAGVGDGGGGGTMGMPEVSFRLHDTSGISVLDTSHAGGSPSRSRIGGEAPVGEKSRLVNALVSDLEHRLAKLNTEVVQLRAFRTRLAAFETEASHVLFSLRKSSSRAAAVEAASATAGAEARAAAGEATALAAAQVHALWATSQQFHALLPNAAALASMLHSDFALATERANNQATSIRRQQLQWDNDRRHLTARIEHLTEMHKKQQEALEEAQGEVAALGKARAAQSQEMAKVMAERDEMAAERVKVAEKARALQVAIGQRESHARNAAKNAELESRELRAQMLHLQAHLAGLGADLPTTSVAPGAASRSTLATTATGTRPTSVP